MYRDSMRERKLQSHLKQLEKMRADLIKLRMTIAQDKVDKICNLALSNDQANLDVLLQTASIHTRSRGRLYTPVMVLAKQGHANAVNLLLNRYGASLFEAISGYAEGGHDEEVEKTIKKANDIQASLDAAVWGYAKGFHMDKVNQLIERGASRDCALTGFVQGGSSNIQELLRNVVKLNDFDLRKLMIKSVQPTFHFDSEKMIAYAYQVRALMANYGFNYSQALAWRNNLHCWLLQVYPMLKSQYRVPADILVMITSLFLTLSYQDTNFLINKHREIVPKKLFDRSISAAEQKRNPSTSLFSSLYMFFRPPVTIEQCLNEQRQAVERYHYRIQ